MKVRILLATALLSIATLPAAAQSVKLSFHGGKVDLVAVNATVRAILTEWARVGGTRIVNAERLAGPPVTVEFKDAYEQHVLEALLRSVSGYIVGPRPLADAPNSSGFDRIVLLPTSTAPRTAPVTPTASRPPGPQPILRLPAPIDDNDDDNDDNEPAVASAPGAVRPETPADLRRRLGQILESEPDDDDAEPEPAPTAPANPFGITGGAARPGMITPAPARPGARPTPAPATQP